MTHATRREVLGAALAARVTSMVPRESMAADPPQRHGRPVIKAGIAAYSYRDRLTGKKAPAMTITEFVRVAAETGWDGVELTSYYFPNPITASFLADLKRLCFVNGLQVAGASVGNVFTHPSGPARDAEIERVRTWLHHAAALGAPVLRVFAGAPQAGQRSEDAERCCIECLEACAHTAAETGVMLALENHGGIVAEAEGILRIIKAVRSPWCAVNLDTGNFRTPDPYRDIALCAPYAVTTHLKTEVQPRGGARAPADIPRIVKILADAGYRGYLTLEYEAAAPIEEEAPRILSAIHRATASLR